MRNKMTKVIDSLADKNSNFMVVIDDTGFQTFEEFEKKHPTQFVNVGIAEQQFIGFSAGLALEGMDVVLYNVCTFYIRAMEQIRLDVAYQNVGLVMIGVGGGLYYGTQGPTHHATEDIAMFRALPNMTIICPADPLEMEEAMIQSINSHKPTYIRICKNNDPVLHKEKPNFSIGKAIIMREGSDIALIATGGMVREALTVAEKLEDFGLNARVVNMHTIKPIDKDMVADCITHFSAVFTFEEHSIIGGLGSAVAEFMSQSNIHTLKFGMFGFQDCFAPVTGTRDYLNMLYNLDASSMTDKIINTVKDIFNFIA